MITVLSNVVRCALCASCHVSSTTLAATDSWLLIETPFERKATGKVLMAAWFRYACLKNRKGH